VRAARGAGGGLHLLCHGLGRRRRCQGAAAAALWFGFGHLLHYLVYASLFGGA
jgi:hypothetical protein